MDQHFDAERLAAFADGSLSPAERAAAEAHAADCAQCLHLLAAMARTHEEPARPSGGAWRLPVFVRWAAPLAAVATGVALWLNVAGGPQQAVQQPTEQAQASVPAAAADEAKAPVDRSVPSSPDSANLRDLAKEKSTATKDVAEPTAPREEKREAFDRLDARAEPAKPTARLSARRKVATPAPEADKLAAAPPLTSVADAPLPGTPAPPPSAPAPPASAAPAPAAEPRLGALAETVSTERAAVGKVADAKGARQRFASAVVVEARSPDQRYRWRVNGAVVERSVDGGSTWALVPGMPGAQVSAIAAPSPTVAWFVGRAGAVLLFSDNIWSRLTFPESIDLVTVRALSARESTVTTVDGRTFRTTDGGQTWSLQEIPPPAF